MTQTRKHICDTEDPQRPCCWVARRTELDRLQKMDDARIASFANPEYQWILGDMQMEFTCYRAKAAARRTVNESLNPCLIEISGFDSDGNKHVWYDAYPAGHPIPHNAVVYYNDAGGTVHARVEIVERCQLTATGMRWRAVSRAE